MGFITNIALSGIVNSIFAVFPPHYDKSVGTNLYKFLSGIASGFAMNIQQMNELYDRSFIATAEDRDLDNLLNDYAGLRRLNDEDDESYRERYFKYVFEYNCTKDSIREIVYDMTNGYPSRMIELNSRSAYWGKANLSLSERYSGTAYYYDDIDQYTAFYGSDRDSKAFVGYIFLSVRPDDDVMNELCKTINSVRAAGTKIYIVVPNGYFATYDEGYLYDSVRTYN